MSTFVHEEELAMCLHVYEEEHAKCPSMYIPRVRVGHMLGYWNGNNSHKLSRICYSYSASVQLSPRQQKFYPHLPL